MITFPSGTDMCDEGVRKDIGSVKRRVVHIAERIQFIEYSSLDQGQKPTLKDCLQRDRCENQERKYQSMMRER